MAIITQTKPCYVNLADQTEPDDKETCKLKNKINDALIDLSVNIMKKGFEVSMLTELDGNCIFSSVHSFGYGENPTVLRNFVSLMMYEYREYKGFIDIFPDNTLTELYAIYPNSKPFNVFDKKIKQIVPYTFPVMCKDLCNPGEWKRINVELLFLSLSKLLNIEIIIHHDVDSTVKKYSACKKKYKNKVYLGYVCKCHYVPLKKKIDKNCDLDSVPQYQIIV